MKKIQVMFIIVVLAIVGFFFVREKQTKQISTQPSVVVTSELFDEFGSFEYQENNLAVSARVPFTPEGVLVSDIETFASNYISSFISDMSDGASTASFPYNLTLDFEVFESQAIISYVVQGYEFTGGAHGNTFFKSFNYDKSSGAKLDVLDIVTSPDQLWTFAALADKELVVQYPEGVSGDNPENWSVWYATDTDVTFIFAPYQIASFANGVQEFTIVAVSDNASMFDQKYFNSL